MMSNDTLPEELRQQRNDQKFITRYLSNDDREVRNEGHVGTIKAPFNTRILSIKTCGLVTSKYKNADDDSIM